MVTYPHHIYYFDYAQPVSPLEGSFLMTLMFVDFGDSFFAFVYSTENGSVTEGFQPSIYGTANEIIGTR
jgi:hypothetical protein